MKRGLAGAIVVLMALGALVTWQDSPAGAAPGQTVACFPGSDPDYPPTGNGTDLEPLGLVNGQFNPGGNGTFAVNNGDAGDTYCGFIFSTPITLVPKLANAQGRVEWSFAVPSDFQLNALHHADIYKNQSRVAAFDFCVGLQGTIVPVSSCRTVQASTTSTTQQVQGGSKTTSATTAAGKLPRTGSDVLGFLQVAVLAVGIGVGLLYLRRRRVARIAV